MSLKIITPPAAEPLSLKEAKQYLRVDGSDDDALITALIKQAREYCEDYQGKKFITQTLEIVLDSFPTGDIEFRTCSPVQSLTSIKYTDSVGTERTLDSSNYILDNDSFVNRIALAYNKIWPTDTLQSISGVRVRFIAGYAPGEADGQGIIDYAVNVPESVKFAMVLHMKVLGDGILFNIRAEDKSKLEVARDNLLGMRRVISI